MRNRFKKGLYVGALSNGGLMGCIDKPSVKKTRSYRAHPLASRFPTGRGVLRILSRPRCSACQGSANLAQMNFRTSAVQGITTIQQFSFSGHRKRTTLRRAREISQHDRKKSRRVTNVTNRGTHRLLSNGFPNVRYSTQVGAQLLIRKWLPWLTIPTGGNAGFSSR